MEISVILRTSEYNRFYPENNFNPCFKIGSKHNFDLNQELEYIWFYLRHGNKQPYTFSPENSVKRNLDLFPVSPLGE